MTAAMLRLLVVLLWFPVFSQVSAQAEASASFDQQLDTLQTQAQAALDQRTDAEQKYASLLAQVEELMSESSKLEQFEKELLQRTLAVDDLVKQANAVKLRYVAWLLNTTLQKELEHRQTVIEQYSNKDTVDRTNAVTLETLNQIMEPTRLLEDSETNLQEWIQDVIRQQMADFYKDMSVTAGQCVTPVEAAQLVQTSLTSQQQQVNHAQQGHIVHEMTSDTYIPPPNQALGTVWWRKYIPEDWERILPSGWQDWSAEMPSFLMHSLGSSSADTVPPEVILTGTSTAHPGSCWPMAGRNGQVTIRLPDPVDVKAITIDHASSLLLDDTSSAPRAIRVIAYPPCGEDDDCGGMGFDMNKAWELTSMEYNSPKGTSSQTFEIPTAAASCSEDAPSCTADADPLGQLHVAVSKQDQSAAAGITIDILDNWGLPDYTCLYRVGIHGDVVDS